MYEINGNGFVLRQRVSVVKCEPQGITRWEAHREAVLNNSPAPLTPAARFLPPILASQHQKNQLNFLNSSTRPGKVEPLRDPELHSQR
ncbi:MAG: hypothetical protein ACLFQV_04720 [Vulcanimicrobiota bacterium]